MLNFLKLLEEAELEINDKRGEIALDEPGKYYNIQQINYCDNYYDIDKLILKQAIKDIEKLQELVNRYSEIQLDLLN